jgi:hypothetical protein
MPHVRLIQVTAVTNPRAARISSTNALMISVNP